MRRSAVLLAVGLLFSMLATAPADAGAPAVSAERPWIAGTEKNAERDGDDEGDREETPRASETATPQPRAVVRQDPGLGRGREPATPLSIPDLPMSAVLYALLAIGIGLHMIGRLRNKATTETSPDWSERVELPDKLAAAAAPSLVASPPQAERGPAVQSVQRVRSGRMRGNQPLVPSARGGFGRRG